MHPDAIGATPARIQRQPDRVLRYVPRVILWINGTFGVGKTTTAPDLVREREPSWRLFDPESVGSMLTANLLGVEGYDFQDLAASRDLVPRVASEIVSLTGDNLLAVQTVLVEEYWLELKLGLTTAGAWTCAMCSSTPTSRYCARGSRPTSPRDRWRLDHLDAYESARSWMRASADLVVDTTGLAAADVADRICATLR